MVNFAAGDDAPPASLSGESSLRLLMDISRGASSSGGGMYRVGGVVAGDR